MELDELKSQLKHKMATDHAGRSDADLAQLLHKRTSSVVGKIKRSLLFEIRLSVPFILFFGLYAAFSKHATFRVYFSVSAVLLLAIMIVLLYLLKRTKDLSSSALPVKENLQLIVNIIQQFIKRCFQIAVLMVPVLILFVVFLQYNFRETSTLSAKFAGGHFKSPWMVIGVLFLYACVFTVVMYFFAKWYLHKMYGKYVAQLKDCIEELEVE